MAAEASGEGSSRLANLKNKIRVEGEKPRRGFVFMWSAQARLRFYPGKLASRLPRLCHFSNNSSHALTTAIDEFFMNWVKTLLVKTITE
ncbi:MAG: hypothetical protein ABFD69_14020 [Candidatus Sumerlaeia bacterium]